MFGRVIKFLYFDLGMELRYLFWKLFLASSGGKIGKAAKIYEGVRIVCNYPGKIEIGNRVRVLRNATIVTSSSGRLYIGNNVHIGEGTIIYSDKEIRINDNVIIGPYNVIVDFDHVYSSAEIPIRKQGHKAQEITIEEDVWISSHCTVIKGVKLGRGSVVGAGSVVNKNVDPYAVVAGVPAKTIKKRSILGIK